MTAGYLPPADRARALDRLGSLDSVDLGAPCPACRSTTGHEHGCGLTPPRPTSEALAAAWEPARNGWTP